MARPSRKFRRSGVTGKSKLNRASLNKSRHHYNAGEGKEWSPIHPRLANEADATRPNCPPMSPAQLRGAFVELAPLPWS